MVSEHGGKSGSPCTLQVGLLAQLFENMPMSSEMVTDVSRDGQNVSSNTAC